METKISFINLPMCIDGSMVDGRLHDARPCLHESEPEEESIAVEKNIHTNSPVMSMYRYWGKYLGL